MTAVLSSFAPRLRSRLARRSGICAILALASSSLVLGSPTPTPEATATAPRLTIDQKDFDFGEVPAAERVEHTFLLKNEGTSTLEIQSVLPQPPLRVVASPRRIEAGATAPLTIEWQLSAETDVRKGLVQVLSNDPEQAEMLLSLMLTVKSHLQAKPGYARWMSVQGEKDGTIAQQIMAIDGQAFAVSKVEVPRQGVRYRLAAEEESPGAAGRAKAWTLDLTLDQWAPVGTIEGFVAVYTDHPLQKRLLLPISGFMRPILAATPPALPFGEIKLTQATSQQIDIRNFATDPIRVTRVEIDVPGFQPPTFKALQEGRRYVVELPLGLDLPKGPFKGQVRVHTDSPKIPMLAIELSGTVVEAVANP